MAASGDDSDGGGDASDGGEGADGSGGTLTLSLSLSRLRARARAQRCHTSRTHQIFDANHRWNTRSSSPPGLTSRLENIGASCYLHSPNQPPRCVSFSLSLSLSLFLSLQRVPLASFAPLAALSLALALSIACSFSSLWSTFSCRTFNVKRDAPIPSFADIYRFCVSKTSNLFLHNTTDVPSRIWSRRTWI